MKSYVSTILISSLVGGIINSIIPQKSKLKKYVLFIVTLVCSLVLIQPISTILSSAKEIKDAASSFFNSISLQDQINSTNDIIISTSKDRIEKGIKDLVIDKYNFPENEVLVEIILNEETIDAIKIEKILVFISGKSSWSDADAIEKYLKNIVSSEVEVKRR